MFHTFDLLSMGLLQPFHLFLLIYETTTCLETPGGLREHKIDKKAGVISGTLLLFGDYQHNTAVFSYLKGTHWFSEVQVDRTEGKRLKLQEETSN